MPYHLLFVILGLCLGLLVLAGYRLYRQHAADLKHTTSLHRTRRNTRRAPRDAE